MKGQEVTSKALACAVSLTMVTSMTPSAAWALVESAEGGSSTEQESAQVDPGSQFETSEEESYDAPVVAPRESEDAPAVSSGAESDGADPQSNEAESNLVAFAANDGVAVQSADALQSAVKVGFPLTLTTNSPDAWAQDTSEEGRIAAKGSGNADATLKVSGEGWVVFDWKMAEGNWRDKCTLTVDGASKGSIASNSSNDRSWKTLAVQVTGDGEHEITWSSVGSSSVYLSNVRVATSKTQVSASGERVSTTITLGGEEVSSVAPGSKVTFTAVPAEGYVFAGWKASAQDEGYLATTAAYEVTVYDDPISLIAVVEKPFAGSGTEVAPFEVSSKEDLQKIADYVEKGNSFSGTFFKLTGDIDFGGLEFAGIGSSNSFSGTFDGAGNSISDIKLTNGLFGKTSKATIKNLTVDGTVTATTDNAGMIVGIQADGVIDGCVAKGAVTSTQRYVGGIVGKAGGSVSDCVSNATVHSTYSNNLYGYIGGIAGQSQYGVKGCVNAGEVSAPDACKVGGICGDGSMLTVVDGCYNYGNVSGKSYVGGIMGQLESRTEVRNSASRGNVTAVNQAAGIVGYTDTTSGGVIDSCYATGDITSTGNSQDSCAGGIVGYATKKISIENCLSLVRKVGGNACGRAAGSSVADQWNGAPVLADNYGLSTTLVDGEEASADLGADAINGATITPAELYGDTVAAPMNKWSADAWSITAGQLPVLKSVPEEVQAGFPDYVVKPVVEHVKDALAEGASLDIAANNNDLWTTETDGDRTYAVGAQGATVADSASATVTVNGSGWLIFDWKATGGSWSDKLSYTGLSWPTGANNLKKWTTVVVPVTGDGDHAITIGWSAVSGSGTAKFQLDNVRFASEKTAVNVAAAKGCEDMLDISVSENPATPGSTVKVTATPKSGYVFTGWKTAESDADFASTSQIMSVSVLDQAISYVAYAEKPFEGAGTAEDPYQISSVSDLNKLDAYTQTGNTFAGSTLKLTGDIAISDADSFTGIAGKFAGTFDGANHVITGSKAPQGIFKELASGSVVKDLTVEANAESNVDNSGIIAGNAAGTIQNCTVKGSITSSGKNVGGVVGYLGGNGVIENCASTAKVTCTSSTTYQTSVGGVAGTASYSTAIMGCQIGGSVDGGSSASGVGGVIGRIQSTTAVSGCYVTAIVSGNENVGGIAGEYTSGGSGAGLENNAFNGFVSGKNSVGGIAGKVEANSVNAKVRNNLAFGKISATGNYAGGILGSVSKPATIEGNVSLVESVDGAIAARVIGDNVKPSWGSMATIGNNYAYAGAKVNGNTAEADSAIDSLNGKGVSAAELFGTDSAAAFDSWSVDAWAIAAGKCPLVKAVSAEVQQAEYPLYIKVSLDEMTPSIADVAYTGQVAAPELTFAMGSLSAKGADFSVSYQNAAGETVSPVAVGEYKAVATADGQGRFTGSATVSFNVLAADMSSVDAKAIPSQNYTGAAIEPQLELTLNGVALTANDYDVAYFDAEGNPVAAPTAVGAYKVVATGKGNFTGAKELSFSIASESLEKAVVGAAADAKYTGEAIKPIPSVTLNGVALSADDFEVSYKDAAGKQVDPTNVGTYTIVVTGKGNYAGETSGSFNIVKADGMVASAAPATATYDGKGHTVGAVSAKGAKGEELSGLTVKYYNEQTKDYDLDQAPELTNVGTMAVKFKVSQANYNDAEGQASVTVTSADGMVASAEPATATYDASGHSINAPKATVDGKAIENATVKYFNEQTGAYDLTQAPQFENVGTYTVKFQVVDSQGNYNPAEGVATLTISAAAIDQASVENIEEATFTGSAVSVDPKASFKGKQLVVGQDYEVSYVNEQGQPIEPVAVGSYKVVLTGKGNFAGTKQVEFSVVAASIESAAVKPVSDITYTGRMQKPVPEVELNGASLNAGIDFDVTYQDADGKTVNPINAGSYKIVVKGKGNYTGEAIGEFAIAKADGMIANAANETVTYSGTAQTIGVVSVTANGRALENVTIKYYNEDTKTYDLDKAPTQTNVGSLKVKFRVSQQNYNDVEGEATVTVNPSDKLGAQADNVNAVYDRAGHGIGDVHAIVGTTVLEGAQVKFFNEQSQAYDLNESPTFTEVGSYTVKFQVSDPAGNYLSAENSATVTIAQADISSATVKAIDDVVYTGKALDVVPTVSFAGSNLEQGTDFDVTYETASGSAVTPTGVGSYVAVVTGKGSFTGTARIGFNVVAPSVIDPATGVIAQGTVFVDKAPEGGSVKLEVKSLGEDVEHIGNLGKVVQFSVSLVLLDQNGNEIDRITDSFGDLTLSFPVGSEYDGRDYSILAVVKNEAKSNMFGDLVANGAEVASTGTVTGGVATATVQSLPEKFAVIVAGKAENQGQENTKTDTTNQSSADVSNSNDGNGNSGNNAGNANATAQTGDNAATVPLAATAGIAGLIAAFVARIRARREKW